MKYYTAVNINKKKVSHHITISILMCGHMIMLVVASTISNTICLNFLVLVMCGSLFFGGYFSLLLMYPYRCILVSSIFGLVYFLGCCGNVYGI